MRNAKVFQRKLALALALTLLAFSSVLAQPPKEVVCKITAYTNSPEETNEDSLTATMVEPTPGKTVAVSRDLISWLGGRIYIPGIGVRHVEDLMASRWTKKIDLLMPTKEKAQAFGVQEKRVIFLGL